MFHDGTAIQFQNLIVLFFCISFLLVVDTSRLYNRTAELVTTTTLEDVGDVWTHTCKSAEWRIQIPNLRNLRLLPRRKDAVKASRSTALIRKSKMFQNSSLQITQQVANTFRMNNASGTELKILSLDVDNQFEDTNHCVESSSLFECMEPLNNITDKTKQIAQLFYLMAAHFEELISLMRTVRNSTAKMLNKLERANNAVVKRKASRVNSKRKLKIAMRSLDKINTDLIRQLQQERVQLETSSQLWQSVKNRINLTEDEDWANAKIKFDLAKWRWNCSRQALNKTQDKLRNWSQLDEELSLVIAESRQEHVEIEGEMLLLFNGTINSIVQLERYRNVTAEFSEYYKEAANFFLAISSRVSDIVTSIPKIDDGSLPADLRDEFAATLSTNLKKVKCDLDRNGRFVILTHGEALQKDFQRKIVGFVLGGAGKDCDISVN